MKRIWQQFGSVAIGVVFCGVMVILGGCGGANKCEKQPPCEPKPQCETKVKCEANALRSILCAHKDRPCDACAANRDAECPRCALCEHKPKPCESCLARWRSRCERETCSTIYLPNGRPEDGVLKLEKCGPREVRAGEAFKYTIKVTNRTDHALRNVMVVDELPQNMTLAAPVQGGVGWIPEFRLAGAAEGNIVRYNLGDLCPQETRCIEQCGAAAGSGCLSSCLTAYYDLFACVQTKVTQPQLSLEMTGPQEVFICHAEEEAKLRLNIRNPGNGQADNVRVTVSTRMPAGAAQLAASGDTERLVGDLGCEQERNFDLCVRVPEPGEYRVVAEAVAGDGLRTGPRELQFVARFAQLNIRAMGPEHEFIGLPVEYRAQIENTGNAPDTNVLVSAELPPGTLFMGATDGGQASGERVVWSIGNFPPNQPLELGVRLRTADLARTINASFTVCGDCGGQQTAVVTTALEGVPALLVEMCDVQDPLRVGETAEYRITVVNQGSAPETNIRVAARVPDEMSFVGSTGPTEPHVDGQELMFAPVSLLAPKEQITWSVLAHCNRPGDLRMAVQVQSDENQRPIRETEATRVY